MDAILHTTAGDIVVELLPNHAPKTVKNFTDLATGAGTWTHPETGESSNEPLYNGTIFHRVIPNFMIQGGDPLGTGRGGPGYAFDDEIHPELHFREPYVLVSVRVSAPHWLRWLDPEHLVPGSYVRCRPWFGA
ncbi:peptidylprolyl isomerase, partial [Occultella aeris]